MASTSGGHFSLTNYPVTSKTALWAALYLLRSNATWQWFRICASVFFPPQLIVFRQTVTLPPHSYVCIVQQRMFKVNFRASRGSLCTFIDHRVTLLPAVEPPLW